MPFVLALLALTGLERLQRAVPIDPPRAVELARAPGPRRRPSVYRMRVAQARRIAGVLFLYSDEACRTGCLIFRISAAARKAFDDAYHQTPDSLRGRIVLAYGIARSAGDGDDGRNGPAGYVVAVSHEGDVDIQITAVPTPA